MTCPYVSRPADSLPSLLEAQYLDAEFVPSAIFAHEALGVLVGLGATIAVRRRDLTRAGGYAGIADYLTDDYQVVERISRLGLRVELCNYVVTHVLGDAGFREQWDREVRWALGVRTCSPARLPRPASDVHHAAGPRAGGGDRVFRRRNGDCWRRPCSSGCCWHGGCRSYFAADGSGGASFGSRFGNA